MHSLAASGLAPVDTAVVRTRPQVVDVAGVFHTDVGFRASLESDSTASAPRVLHFVLTS